MNAFEKSVAAADGLFALDISTVQVNLSLRCNQQCRHCHLRCSPRRTEEMEWPTMVDVIYVCMAAGCHQVDITGGAPEWNPHFRPFVRSLRALDINVQLRTNLTVLAEPGMKDLPEFLRDSRIALAASMPCYLEENVRAQRGAGVYERSIAALRRLNAVGYGSDPALPLALVYNPGGPFLPPPQAELEADYRRELRERHGVVFTRLLTITNMPLGRFHGRLRREGKAREYQRLLKGSFNPATVAGLMCRHQVSIGWNGALYDCDFNLATGLAMDHGAPNHVRDFDPETVRTRRIVTRDYCFGCTAGCGSSCSGALA